MSTSGAGSVRALACAFSLLPNQPRTVLQPVTANTHSAIAAIRNARDMALHMRNVRVGRLDGLVESLLDPKFSEYKTLILVIE